ncbi:glycosyl transferase, group 2 family protein [Candidatus Moduliflexus flocculans]|uniref:Glycosyl transferase, group 2 family protein n=1 Tax=Candidatus Moduliflexus flocculans TaxID=1499966 RepID=A0A0S6VXJ9_9BACT|nr:glycosyl transferase, group 2 family protein [Candidatus Moduliflexus flocculans]
MMSKSYSLQQLPPAPPGKTGWPWTEETSSGSTKKPDGTPWPRMTVVTPSYNQADFLEETLRSVLLQGYPNLEYLVIDGGSTDGSVELIKKYAPYLTHWVSEPDRGQSHAINKGLQQAHGEILCWLNSDDLLKPGALYHVASMFRDLAAPSWIVGATELIARDGTYLDIQQVRDIDERFFLTWSDRIWLPQQSTFWNRAMWELVKPLREDLTYVMDVALWLKMFQVVRPETTPRILSSYRIHEVSKTVSAPMHSRQELIELLKIYLRQVPHSESAKRLFISHQSEEMLEWAYKSYDAHYYRNASEELWFAVRMFPSMILKKKWLFLAILLKMGGGSSATRE